MKYYDREGKPTTYEEWERIMLSDRKIERDELPGGILISTVFLGIDTSCLDDENPELYETMAFSPEKDELYCIRHTTEAKARERHKLLVEITRARLDLNLKLF